MDRGTRIKTEMKGSMKYELELQKHMKLLLHLLLHYRQNGIIINRFAKQIASFESFTSSLYVYQSSAIKKYRCKNGTIEKKSYRKQLQLLGLLKEQIFNYLRETRRKNTLLLLLKSRNRIYNANKVETA